MDEQQFRKIIIKIRALAKSQSESISKEQVHEKFVPANITDEQLMLVYKYLEEEKVTLFETEEDRLAVSEKEIDDGSEAVTVSDDAVNDCLKIYFDTLDELEEPDADSRKKIIEDILDNRDKAEELLPELYVKAVVDIARLYEGQGVTLEDLIGEGNIGILLGIKMLDCCESAEEVEEFITKMIMDSMESIILEKASFDDFDVKTLERVNDLNEKAREIAEDLERKVTVEELAAELNVEVDYIRETVRLSGNAISYIEGCKD